MEIWKAASCLGGRVQRSEKGGKWVRGRVLGRGGYGRVSVAYFPERSWSMFGGMPDVAAVKSCEMRDKSMKDLSRERRMHESFKECPFIVKGLGDDVTVENEKLILNVFTEYASGGALARHVASGLTEAQVRSYTVSILRGIQAIHERGMVHGDVRLENVVLFETEQGFAAKLANLGTARHACEFRPGVRCGDPQYWAPEVYGGGVQGKASDIWALGFVVFAMLTGALPYTTPRQVKSLSAQDFLSQCLRRDPLQRPTVDVLLTHPFLTDLDDSTLDNIAIDSYLNEISQFPLHHQMSQFSLDDTLDASTHDRFAIDSYLNQIFALKT